MNDDSSLLVVFVPLPFLAKYVFPFLAREIFSEVPFFELSLILVFTNMSYQ